MAVAEIEEKEVGLEVEEEIEISTEEKADASTAREKVIRLLTAKKVAETEMVAEVDQDQAATNQRIDTTEEADLQNTETTKEEIEEEVPEEILETEVTPETTKEETITEVVVNLDPEVCLTIAKTTITREMADVKSGLDLGLFPEAMMAKEEVAVENSLETHDQTLLLKTMINQEVREKQDLKAQSPIIPNTLPVVEMDRSSKETKEVEVLQATKVETEA